MWPPLIGHIFNHYIQITSQIIVLLTPQAHSNLFPDMDSLLTISYVSFSNMMFSDKTILTILTSLNGHMQASFFNT